MNIAPLFSPAYSDNQKAVSIHLPKTLEELHEVYELEPLLPKKDPLPKDVQDRRDIVLGVLHNIMQVMKRAMVIYYTSIFSTQSATHMAFSLHFRHLHAS